MELDREIQNKILAKLKANYPKFVEISSIDRQSKSGEGNINYLEEHGLCVLEEVKQPENSPIRNWHRGRITAKGLDFLADDGGLSAILGVVTIKLHDDTIKALIESKILQSDLPEPEKKRFLAQLRELPAETTKHLVLKLVDLGLDKAPTAIETIGTFLKNL